MRIVLWSRSFPPAVGGLERFSEELAEWLSARGHSVVVLTTTRDPGRRSTPEHYRVVRSASVSGARRLMRDAHVIHAAGLSARAILFSWSAGRRPVITHEGPQAICPAGLAWSPTGTCDAGPRPGPCQSCPQRGLRGAADVHAHRAAAIVGATSVFCSSYLRDRVGLRGEVVYNPVPATLFELPVARSGSSRVIAAGRFVQEKGFDLLLRAMSHVDAPLSLAGDGPLRASLEGLADDLGLSPRVTFTGLLGLPALTDLFAEAAITCIPSLCGEAFGYAVAEAMAAGLPVVGTPVGAIPELLGHDRGTIADGVTPEALAASIRSALADEGERTRRAERARSFARAELHIDEIGPKYEEIYRA